MIEQVHQHLLSERERTTRADTVFVVCAVLFNILALFISWTQVPTGGTYPSGSLGIYILTTIGILVISGAALKALQNGRCKETLAQLESLGNEKVRAQNIRNGALFFNLS